MMESPKSNYIFGEKKKKEGIDVCRYRVIINVEASAKWYRVEGIEFGKVTDDGIGNH